MKLMCRAVINPVWDLDLYNQRDGNIFYQGCVIFVSSIDRLLNTNTYEAGETIFYKEYIKDFSVIHRFKIVSISYIRDDYEGLLMDHYFMDLELLDGSVWHFTPYQRDLDPEILYFSRGWYDVWVAREEICPGRK